MIANGLAKWTGGFVTISLTAPDGLDYGQLVTHMCVFFLFPQLVHLLTLFQSSV